MCKDCNQHRERMIDAPLKALLLDRRFTITGIDRYEDSEDIGIVFTRPGWWKRVKEQYVVRVSVVEIHPIFPIFEGQKT